MAGLYIESFRPKTKAELAVPMLESNGDLIGVLNVESTKEGGLDEENRRLLEILAVQAVIAVHRVDLYQRLERQIKPLHSRV